MICLVYGTSNKICLELQDSVVKAKDSSDEMIKIRKEMVDFHGEMVLLENYSALNYTDLLYKLVKECEALLDRLFPLTEPNEVSNNVAGDTSTSDTSDATTRLVGAKELAELEYMKSLYTKSTISALRVLKEIRSRSSTVSVFSLPPMQINVLEETWNKFPILEQLAK
nr:SPX domain-containing protein [Tanacetum cinerariifolium]